MKKIIKKRNNQLASVYEWAVTYSLDKASERRKECEKKTKTSPGKPKLR